MKKKYVKFISLLLLIIGVAITYSIFDPSTNKYFPTCPFNKFTGLFCPGCGSQRALHYLLVGNLQAALSSNLLLVIFLPLLLFYYLAEAINYFSPKKLVHINIVNKGWFIYSITGVIIVFWIVRNVSFSAPNILAPH